MRHRSDQRTALVLGGGGITGIAWEIGVLAGLAEAGTDLSGADLVVGTSAGSVVARSWPAGPSSRRCTDGSWNRRRRRRRRG
jgi:predicted acylesterase/phospholipase RssA